MPAFWILLVLGLILLWFLCAFLYKPLGKLFHRIWKDAMDEIDKD